MGGGGSGQRKITDENSAEGEKKEVKKKKKVAEEDGGESSSVGKGLTGSPSRARGNGGGQLCVRPAALLRHRGRHPRVLGGFPHQDSTLASRYRD